MTTAIINKMSEKEQKALLEKLLAQKEKARERAKEYRDNNKEKAAAWGERARVRAQILLKKAKEAGLSVSEGEVDAYLASKEV